MPKLNRGGQRGTSSASFFSSTNQNQTVNTQSVKPNTLPPITNTVTTPTPQQVAKGDVTPGGGVPFSKFEKMTDDEKADVIEKALSTGVPIFLGDSGLQRFAYFTGMNNKPQIVSESALKKIPGKSLWRSVSDVRNRSLGISYTANDIAKQIREGDFTNYSGDGNAHGGSAYGKAIYFDVKRGSYGSGSGYAILHAKVSPTAKVIDYSTLTRDLSKEMNSGSKLGKAIAKADYDSRSSLYAIAKGYDLTVDSWSNYHMVLNRRGLVISDKNH